MEKLTYQDRLPAYMTNVVMMLLMVTSWSSPPLRPCSAQAFLKYSRPCEQIGVTFATVFGVIFYRISTKAALHMSSNPVTRSHVQLTVKTTAAIINLVVILILDEVYGAVARWLTVLGKSPHEPPPLPSSSSRPTSRFPSARSSCLVELAPPPQPCSSPVPPWIHQYRAT